MGGPAAERRAQNKNMKKNGRRRRPHPLFPPPPHPSCFQSAPDEPWNWNLYLAPLWSVGVIFRHAILFPLRAALLATAFLLFFAAFFGARPFIPRAKRRGWEKGCVQFLCQAFVASWTGVVRYHGPAPVPRPGHVWVREMEREREE